MSFYKYFFEHGKLNEEHVEALTLRDIDMEWWEEHELWIANAPCNIEADNAFEELDIAQYVFDSWYED